LAGSSYPSIKLSKEVKKPKHSAWLPKKKLPLAGASCNKNHCMSSELVSIRSKGCGIRMYVLQQKFSKGDRVSGRESVSYNESHGVKGECEIDTELGKSLVDKA
jgi:hypothetical protein